MGYITVAVIVPNNLDALKYLEEIMLKYHKNNEEESVHIDVPREKIEEMHKEYNKKFGKVESLEVFVEQCFGLEPNGENFVSLYYVPLGFHDGYHEVPLKILAS